MNLAQSLHTAARRYCQEQFNRWAARYSAIYRAGLDRAADGYHYTREALDMFPRYNVLRAIWVEIERIDPADLKALADTRDLIVLAGMAADDDFTRKPVGHIDAAAMVSEREAFCSFIRGLTEAVLRSVEPLPYRRVMSQTEAESVRCRLRERWQLDDDHWYPLTACALPDVAAFQERYFIDFCTSFNLSALLSSRGISRVWELREGGPEFEQDLALFDPRYNGVEGYWSSGDLDWIVYASHESSITVGGWLLAEVKSNWPKWKQRVWESPFF